VSRGNTRSKRRTTTAPNSLVELSNRLEHLRSSASRYDSGDTRAEIDIAIALCSILEDGFKVRSLMTRLSLPDLMLLSTRTGAGTNGVAPNGRDSSGSQHGAEEEVGAMPLDGLIAALKESASGAKRTVIRTDKPLPEGVGAEVRSTDLFVEVDI